MAVDAIPCDEVGKNRLNQNYFCEMISKPEGENTTTEFWSPRKYSVIIGMSKRISK
jgi:hypothetical protein